MFPLNCSKVPPMSTHLRIIFTTLCCVVCPLAPLADFALFSSSSINITYYATTQILSRISSPKQSNFPITQNKMFIEKNIENSGEEMKTAGTGGVVVDECYIYKEDKHLTVLKTSVFFSGDGFTVYDCSGQLIFRVDSYGPELFKGELVLMDPSGKCLLTVRRKWPSLHQRWEGFLGERQEGQKPLFSVHRSSIIGRSGLRVDMYNDSGEEYYIEGSYAQRQCTIFNEEKESVAEIRRKVDSTSNVMLGKDVFCLSLKPGFDGAFAMGLILVLDQVDGQDYSDDDNDNHEPIRVHAEDASI